MAAANKTIWGIHTMDDPLFLNQNLIAIGWEEMGDLSAISTSRDAYKEKYIAAYPDAKKGSIATSAGMLYRFVHEVQEGDYVVFPSKIDRKINIGVVESAYFYEATAALYPNRRKVKWLKHLPRTAFSQGALHEVGSALSFFQVKNYADEYFKALDKDFKGNILEPDTDETVAQTADEIIEATRDFILKELSKNLGIVKKTAHPESTSSDQRAMCLNPLFTLDQRREIVVVSCVTPEAIIVSFNPTEDELPYLLTWHRNAM